MSAAGAPVAFRTSQPQFDGARLPIRCRVSFAPGGMIMTDTNEQSALVGNAVIPTFTEANWLDIHFLAMQPEYEEMLRWVGLQSGWRVLDAACGSGSFLPLITELIGSMGSVSAIDLLPENVRVVEMRARAEEWPAPVLAQTGSLVELPYPDNSFDAVWCANATEYLTDDELRATLAGFRRVVRSGGLIAIKEYDNTAQQTQPAPPTLLMHLDEAGMRAGHVQSRGLFRTIQLGQWLRDAGLLNVRQKPTLMVRFQPLRPVEKRFVSDMLTALARVAENIELPEGELEIWRSLADLDNPDHIINHPDLQYRAIQTVFVGEVP
jgi:arsenite methyltransferase